MQVQDDLRRTVLGNVLAAESAKVFKRVMWCNRRPRLLRVLAEELVEFDRCVANSREGVSAAAVTTTTTTAVEAFIFVVPCLFVCLIVVSRRPWCKIKNAAVIIDATI